MINIYLATFRRAALGVLALGAAAGAAEMPRTAARSAPEAAFEDWRLDCAAGRCIVATVLAGADGSELLRLEAAGGALSLRTPLPLFLPDGVAFGLGATAPLALDWRTCDAAGCVAEAALEDGLLAALRREREAEVTLTLVEGARVRLPVSLMGFSAAWRALRGAAVRP